MARTKTRTTSNTVAEKSVICVDFLPDGSAWFAVSDGLYHYDGYRWRHYTTEHGLPSMITHSVAADQDGVIWVGTQSGVGKWTGSRFTSYPRGSGLPEDRVRAIYVDPDNNVWLSFIEGGAARIIR